MSQDSNTSVVTTMIPPTAVVNPDAREAAPPTTAAKPYACYYPPPPLMTTRVANPSAIRSRPTANGINPVASAVVTPQSSPEEDSSSIKRRRTGSNDDDAKLSPAPKVRRPLFTASNALKGNALNYVRNHLREDTITGKGNLDILTVLSKRTSSITRVEMNDEILAKGGNPIVQAHPLGGRPPWVNCNIEKLTEYGFVERDKSRKERDDIHDGFLITKVGREALNLSKSIAKAKKEGQSVTVECHTKGQTSMMDYFGKTSSKK